MGLRPTQSDEKRPLSSNHLPLLGSAALPFVISPAPACRGTEATCPGVPWDRSDLSRYAPACRGACRGEISVLTTSPGNVFRQSAA